MTMIERVKIFSNPYFNSLIEKYTDRKEAPESFGMSRAIMAYLKTNDCGLSKLTVDDMPFLQDMDGFMDTIEAAGITEFNLCDNSTGLMESLHYLMAHGWMIAGTCEVEFSHITTRKGLCMKKA
ncbi:hypothetical protein [Enterocloster clostridioformis]|uniref:hypothetical protein n=1 Tax=Enterocloster clostridioformis TaxID=1531 RepID=UPI0018A9104F|nr:hypothetical protein [Enterocloster clostridioformis]MDB2127991.1 hypothetical protein [Enterocloster clostridioformis]DAM28239.1 MAG TPA: hypothetical protein [Caudoviricetes sp.]